MIVILHNIRSSHNVGSIFRTADAIGVEKIYLCGITPAPIDRYGRPDEKIAKTALGAEKYVAWEKTSSIVRLIKKLKNPPAGGGYKIFAIEQDKKAIDLFKFSPHSRGGARASKIAILLGEETTGIPSKILKLCDKILEIPMKGKKESLNVSVAFGVAGYQLNML